MSPPVTVAICTKDRPELLRRCLESMTRLQPPPFEILVVDNGSAGDDTLRVAVARNVRYVREDRPGLSAARNRATAEARGEIIAFTDDDCEVTPQWLAQLVGPYADPAVGCVTGQTLTPIHASPVQQEIGRTSGGMRGDRPYRVSPGAADRVFARAIAGIGANMSFRRHVLQQVGGFPEVFRSAGDDVWIFFAVLRAGHAIEYAPGAAVQQHHRETLSRQLRRTYFYGSQTALVFMYMTADRERPILFPFNVAREVAVRCRILLRALGRRSLAGSLFAASGIAGLCVAALAVPFRARRIRREVQQLRERRGPAGVGGGASEPPRAAV